MREAVLTVDLYWHDDAVRKLFGYSPDLYPIEMAFGTLKALLRKAAKRTIPRLLRRIGGVAMPW